MGMGGVCVWRGGSICSGVCVEGGGGSQFHDKILNVGYSKYICF